MKGLKIKFKVAEGPPRPQDTSTDTLAVAKTPFAGPKMFGVQAAPTKSKEPRQVQPKPEVPPLEQPPLEVPPLEQPPLEVPPLEQPPLEVPPLEVPPLEQPSPEEPVAEVSKPTLEETKPEESIKRRIITIKKNPLPPELTALQSSIEAKEHENPYEEKIAHPFVSTDSKAFTKFIESRYSSFTLPRPLTKEINPDACSQMTLQTYKYQAFIREYMREANPYRGVLVYHGLGSGKTCTSIGAAEALYGQGKKIIILTPVALKENFLNELMFCGFRHFQLNNKWVSFPLTPVVTTFAQQIVGLPLEYIKRIQKGPESNRVLWMPDLSVAESESNFSTLSPAFQTMIRKQIYEMLQNKFTFIGYTGVTKKFLMEIVTKNPTYFDDAVIIVDEIHNLTRLMANKLDKYLVPSKRALTQFQEKDSPYETVKPEPWNPKFANEPDKYSRAYLLYRILTQAKNSKIIALSGTPIVNTPLEISILANILHGYFHCVSDNFIAEDQSLAQSILEKHPRVNYYSFKKNDTGGILLFFTKLDEGYIKQFNDEGVLEGIIYDEEANESIQEIYEQVKQSFSENKIPFQGPPEFSALPLLPPTSEEFNETFVDSGNLSLKNPITFKKRITGLISYYKGSKVELMPSVSKDEIVECPFSPHAFKSYATSRLKELSETKPSKPSLQEAEALAESETTSYRFRSRSSCNFAFPPGIDRPYPGSKEEEESEVGLSKDIYGDGVKVEDIEEVPEEPDEALEEKPLTVKKIEDYQTRLVNALNKLRQASPNIFKLDGPLNENLSNYSAKYSAIIQRTNASKGSSLVYSQFKTVEGIGILSIALDTNGFAPIKLEGTDDNLRFTPETIDSLINRPEQPRYIVYSGGESIRVRQTLINVFNMFIDKLPSEIKKVLSESPLSATKNLQGQLCRVFMITGAGAEGLSLRNVRTVHIMEPYWNKVRTEQVKGRAIRICSHADLPFKERNVEIFNYVSTITPELLKTQQTLEIQDEGRTTDQYILALAEIKEKVNSSFLGAMKSAAVDCKLNEADNEHIKCFVQQGKITDFLYDPRLRQDIASTDQSEVEEEIIRKGYTIKGIQYVGIVKDGKTLLYPSTATDYTKEPPLGEVIDKKVKWFK